MVILSESDGTKSASGVVLVLNGSEPGLFDLGRAAFVPKAGTSSRAPIDLKSTNWASAIAPFRSGSLDGQESSPLPIQAISIPSKVDLVPSNSIFPST